MTHLRLVRPSPAELHAYAEDRKAEEALRLADERELREEARERWSVAALFIILALAVAVL